MKYANAKIILFKVQYLRRLYSEWWALVVLIQIVTGPIAHPSLAHADSTDFAHVSVQFQETLDAARIVTGFPGATAAFVLSDGRAAGFATGLSDVEQRTPMTAETRALSGSVGKTFVAAIVLSLVQEGKLSLDGKVSTWLGDAPWFSQLPNANDITLRHLLTHSSGLADHVHSAAYAQAIAQQLARGTDPEWHSMPEEMIAFVLHQVHQEPSFPAGKGFAYTDTGYLLIGLIIEQVTGGTYYDELQQRILDPLKLTRTTPSNRRELPGLTPGYLAEDNLFGLPRKTTNAEAHLMFSPAGEWTGGGLVTNSLDLARWAKMLYEEKALPKPYVSRQPVDIRSHEGRQ